MAYRFLAAKIYYRNYMATLYVRINNTKKARAPQLQGSSLQQPIQKHWYFRLAPEALFTSIPPEHRVFPQPLRPVDVLLDKKKW
jgi:hypothetical protein